MRILLTQQTQDLLTLSTLCNKVGILTVFEQEKLDKLLVYGAHAYGPLDFKITLEQAKEAVRIATTIRRFARSFLGLKR